MYRSIVPLLFGGCVLLLSEAFAQDVDEYPFVNRANKLEYREDETFDIQILGDKRSIDTVWNAALKRSKQDDTLLGRWWLEEFPAETWRECIKLNDRPAAIASQIYVIDFACDYSEQRSRQDFWSIDPNKVSEFSLDELRIAYSPKKHPILSPLGPENAISSFLKASTVEYQTVRDTTGTLTVSLPKKVRRQWPGIVDLRTIGLFSIPQWQLPTSLEQWEHVMPHDMPISLEKVDQNLTRIVYFTQGGPIVRSYLVDTMLNRVVEYVEHPVHSTDSPFQITCPRVKTFHNKMEYDDRGNLKAFALGSPQYVLRGTVLESQSGKQISEELFAPRALCRSDTKITVDRSIAEYVDLLESLQVLELLQDK